MKQKTGFTLMEALVATLIISILAAIILPVGTICVRKAKIARAKAITRQGYISAYIEHGKNFPEYGMTTDNNFWPQHNGPILPEYLE